MEILPTRGRPGVTLMMSVDSHLTKEDIYKLATEPSPKVAAPVIQKLRTRHHMIARLLATGRSYKEVAIAANITPQRVGDLCHDPAFQSLMHYYADQIAETTITAEQRAREQLVDIEEQSLDIIQERLEDEEIRKTIPIGELRALAIMGLDRTVAPPKTAVTGTTAPIKVTFNPGPKDIRQLSVEVTDAIEVEQENETGTPEPQDPKNQPDK